MLNFEEWQWIYKTRNDILNVSTVEVEKRICNALSEFRKGLNPSLEERHVFFKQFSSLFLNILVNLEFPDTAADHTLALENAKKARDILRDIIMEYREKIKNNL